MKKTKRWLTLVLAGLLAFPQVEILKAEVTDSAETYFEEETLDDGVDALPIIDFDWVNDQPDIAVEGAKKEEEAESEEKETEEIEGETAKKEDENLLFSGYEAEEQELDLVGSNSGECGENLTWNLDDNGTLTISGTGILNDPYFMWDNNVAVKIKTLVIERGVTQIQSFPFHKCSNLISITIPDSVTAIEGRLGDNCSNLKEIIVSEKNAYYSSENGVLFDKNKTKLISCPEGKTGSYIIPESVMEIDWAAFCTCSSLTSITIPSSVKEIGQGAFSLCSSLTSVTIPNSVTELGAGAFNHCSSLTSINLSNSLTKIEGATFSSCRSLKSIMIPNGVTQIGQEAFSQCSSLTSITIPNGVTQIGQAAFYQCTSLTSITIPKNVEVIEPWAFYECIKLSMVKIENDNCYIMSEVFRDCYNLETINLPAETTTINADIFKGCKKLKNISIPSKVTTILYSAFEGCSSLAEITIPSSVYTVEGEIFKDCSGLKSIRFKGHAPRISRWWRDSDRTVFKGVKSTAYYPAASTTWTKTVRDSFGGNLTWIAEENGDALPVSTIPATTTTIYGFYNSVKGADIRWQMIDECDGYTVYRKRAAEGTKKIATINDPSITQVFDSEIKDNCWGRVYTYFVRPIYGTKEGNKSAEITLQRLAPMKAASCKNNSPGKVDLRWICTVKDNKAYGYEIQYATSTDELYGQRGSFKKIPVEGRNSLSKTIAGLAKGKSYYFRIRCYVNYTHSVTKKTTKTWSQYSDVFHVKISK